MLGRSLSADSCSAAWLHVCNVTVWCRKYNCPRSLSYKLVRVLVIVHCTSVSQGFRLCITLYEAYNQVLMSDVLVLGSCACEFALMLLASTMAPDQQSSDCPFQCAALMSATACNYIMTTIARAARIDT